jgi:CubicO group peptidase (beta-lactamase class C family)
LSVGRLLGIAAHYASIEAEVLGLVVNRAVHMTLADYLSTRIWQKLVAESDAAWGGGLLLLHCHSA